MGGAVRRFDLLPITVCQSAFMSLTGRYREQAPSHIFLTVLQAFDGAIYRGLGDFQQMPHSQNLCPFGAGQQFAAIECGGRGAVEQAGGGTCGRGLAPDSTVSVNTYATEHRYREQAPSHHELHCKFEG
ncbi:hypothetical protein DK870_17405 [Pseudomonas sp. Q1]|nr:hypothetical protein [Pseudomonas sp. Q1]